MATDRHLGPGRRAAALFLLLPLFALAFVSAGCDPDRPPGLSRRAVPLVDVPAPVMKVAKSTLPGVEFSDAWKNLDREGKLHSFEIRGRSSNGKVREARIAPDGKVLETE